VSRKDKGGGGIKFWVVNVEGSADRSAEVTHNFKLTLSPLDAETKKRLEVASEVVTPVDKTR
jgi:hypothetical protein